MDIRLLLVAAIFVVSFSGTIAELSADPPRNDVRVFRQTIDNKTATSLLTNISIDFINSYNKLKFGKGMKKLKQILRSDIKFDYKLGIKGLRNGTSGKTQGIKDTIQALKMLMNDELGSQCTPKMDNYTRDPFPHIKNPDFPDKDIAFIDIFARFCNGRLYKIEGSAELMWGENGERYYLFWKLLLFPTTMLLPNRTTPFDERLWKYYDYKYIEEIMANKFVDILKNPKSAGKAFKQFFYSKRERILVLYTRNHTNPLYTEEFRLQDKNVTKENVVDYFQRVQKKAGKWNFGANENGRSGLQYEEVTQDGVVWSMFNMFTEEERQWSIRLRIHEAFKPTDKKFSWQIHEIYMYEQP